MDLTFWLELILFILLLAFSGFFSSSETAMFSLSSRHLEQMRRDNNPRIELIQRMLAEPRRLIVTILIGNEFVNVAASVISAAMVIQVFGAENKLFNLFIMVPILLLFGEITPKTLAIRNNIAFATAESRPIDLFAKLITPIRWAVRTVSEWFTTLIVGSERSRGNIVTEDMVRTLAREAVGEGVLDDMEAQFIDQIFELGNKTLDDILTPRADITFISVDAPISEILELRQKTRQSRYPVYREHRDNVIGILHARDLLNVDLEKLEENRDRFVKLLRRPYFVPETKPALELFDRFRDRKRSFALTVDEYGGVTGLVTMEDLLECIFGDIPSPSDQKFKFQELGTNHYSVDGTVDLEEINELLGSHYAGGEMETLAGFVLHKFGELPSEGASIDIGNYQFTVEKIIRNRIATLQVKALESNTLLKPPAEPKTIVETKPATDSGKPPRSPESKDEKDVKEGDSN
ncbi:MAG: HlyC/CorC family transporter [Gammaproteobacteria bacterium]|nr:HlyC/CorC family transporter [Gammaproteobacteria bacterium]